MDSFFPSQMLLSWTRLQRSPRNLNRENLTLYMSLKDNSFTFLWISCSAFTCQWPTWQSELDSNHSESSLIEIKKNAKRKDERKEQGTSFSVTYFNSFTRYFEEACFFPVLPETTGKAFQTEPKFSQMQTCLLFAVPYSPITDPLYVSYDSLLTLVATGKTTPKEKV